MLLFNSFFFPNSGFKVKNWRIIGNSDALSIEPEMLFQLVGMQPNPWLFLISPREMGMKNQDQDQDHS